MEHVKKGVRRVNFWIDSNCRVREKETETEKLTEVKIGIQTRETHTCIHTQTNTRIDNMDSNNRQRERQTNKNTSKDILTATGKKRI